MDDTAVEHPMTVLDALRTQAGDLRAFGRYARELPAFLSRPLRPEHAEAMVAAALARRDVALVELLHRIQVSPRNPYRRLLEHAGVEPGDVRPLVAEHGVEGALSRLYDAGVHLTAGELKGQTPVTRAGLASFTVAADDLDNPLAGGAAVSTTGSSGVPRRARFELAALGHEAAHQHIALHAGGVEAHDLALWRPVPPGIAGLNDVLRNGHLGRPIVRWFSQFPTGAGSGQLRHAALVAATRAIAARAGVPVARPEHVPVDRAYVVAAWLAAHDRPVFLNTTSSSGVRVAAAARERNLDIAGTVFRLGGEPFTEERERRLAAIGCRAIVHYSMTETGRIANACAEPSTRDDVHLLLDKLGVVTRPRRLADGSEVEALYYTPLLPGSAKALVNIESDDYGTLEERDCACPLGRLGLRLHLHSIRSLSKLNSEGMTFGGEALLALVERELPSRFGGGPGDWQLVEEVHDGLSRVVVIASPRIGPVDERAVTDAVLERLAEGADWLRLQARLWREGGTVVVRRAEPHVTAAGKVLPFSPPRPAPSRPAG